MNRFLRGVSVGVVLVVAGLGLSVVVGCGGSSAAPSKMDGKMDGKMAQPTK